jgi:hypothetical protein
MEHYTGFSRRGAIVLSIVIGTLITGLTSCNNSDKPVAAGPNSKQATPSTKTDTVSGLLETLQAHLGISGGEARDDNGQSLQKRTQEEVEKLFRWEYRVAELPVNSGAKELEHSLNNLGSDGWECFHLEVATDHLRALCKRRPRGALAYLKLVPGL